MSLDEFEDPELTRFRERLDRFHNLSMEDRLDLALALLKRHEQDRREEAFKMLRARYPAAAEEMARSFAYHAYEEFPRVARDLLAWLELCLREQDHERHAGLTSEALYHLYNWLQAEALVPYGGQDVLDELKEVNECLENNDKDGAVETLRQLLERFEGHVSPPDVGH